MDVEMMSDSMSKLVPDRRIAGTETRNDVIFVVRMGAGLPGPEVEMTSDLMAERAGTVTGNDVRLDVRMGAGSSGPEVEMTSDSMPE